MGGCSVEGCKNRVTKGGKHFYRFPKDYRRDIWAQFTRKGPDFVPKQSCTICEIHFDESSFIEKKSRICITKDAVPTIFYRETEVGTEKIEIPYNLETKQYTGDESFNKIRGALSSEDEDAIMNRKQLKLEEFKTVCRFCFESKADTKCITLKNLEAYNINPNELLISFSISTDYNDIFSDLLCEDCFQQIVAIDAYRTKCRSAQDEQLRDLEEIEIKIHEVLSVNRNDSKWFKSDVGISNVNKSDVMDVIEEHLDDGYEYHYVNQDASFIEEDLLQQQQQQEQSCKDEVQEIQIVFNDAPDTENQFKIIIKEDIDVSQQYEVILEDQLKPVKDDSIYSNFVVEPTDVYMTPSADEIIKNPQRNKFCFKIYECFFCKIKFAGKKTYKAHKCQVSHVKCEKCDKIFGKVQAYNSHVSHVHGSLPLSSYFCPVCKTVELTTLNQFKMHRRKCNKGNTKPIECEVCQKSCSSLKGYTIHKLFHETRNTVGSSGEKIASDGLNNSKGPAICEICGNSFVSLCGYKMHKKNVHNESSEVYQCDICSKLCPTKRALFDHFRNSHKVDEAPCSVCGKVFRTKVLLKKHMIYHDETKRIFKCNMCPDKAGWFTNVALKRHQRSHFGERPFSCEHCDIAYTTKNQLKLHMMNRHDRQL